VQNVHYQAQNPRRHEVVQLPQRALVPGFEAAR